jgi:hypothetical protein
MGLMGSNPFCHLSALWDLVPKDSVSTPAFGGLSFHYAHSIHPGGHPHECDYLYRKSQCLPLPPQLPEAGGPAFGFFLLALHGRIIPLLEADMEL